MKVSVAGREFASRGESDTEFRKLLSMPVGTIYFPGCEQFAFLLGYLETHSEATSKIGPGISFFRVMRNEFGKGHGWEVARVDGSTIGFSYKQCLRTQPKNDHASDFARTCRVDIAPQIEDFKSRTFTSSTAPCAVCFKPVAAWECEVDHKPPNTFKVILSNFVASNGIDPRTVLYVETGPASPDAFADRSLSLAWQQYHHQNATLQAVHKECHKAETAKRRQSGGSK